MENVRLIAVMLDMQGNVTFCNDFLLRLTGWKRDEVVGGTGFHISCRRRKGSCQEVFLRDDGRRHNDPLDFDNEIQTRQGELRVVSWNNTVLRDPVDESSARPA